MFKLQFTPFHFLSLFPGFIQVSLILDCAGLFEVCLFLSSDSFAEESSSGISLPQLCLSPAAADGTGRSKRDLCPHLVSRWLWLLSHIRNPGDIQAAKTTAGPAMMPVNVLIS